MKLKERLKDMLVRQRLRRLRHLVKSEGQAARGPVSLGEVLAHTVWREPNRANTPPLHIAGSGERYSTLTGIAWLDEDSFIVAHRSGQRVAIFNAAAPEQPVWSADIGHLSDDIAAKRTHDGAWEVLLSGCWDCIYSRHRLERRGETYTLERLEMQPHAQKDFCHGVAYDHSGQGCYSIHTGIDPRMQLGDQIHRLPAPWGVRDICHDSARGRYLAVAVSANPRREVYGGVMTSLWACGEGAREWTCLGLYQNVHSDALDVWGDHVWLPDQVGDRLLAVHAITGEISWIGAGDALDFPHGLGISGDGRIVVTNYGSSSLAIVEAEKLLPA